MNNIVKIFVILLITFVCSFHRVFADEFQNYKLELKNYDEIVLPVGTFVPVITTQQISTETEPEGYKVEFLTTNDLFMHESNIIPKGTAFYGYIEKINEPVIGTNASMKIKITKMVLPDGFEISTQGYLYSTNDNIIGGELTQPAEWVKMPHYQAAFQGIAWNHRSATLQIRPGGVRSMGQHTKIPSGDQRVIILTTPTPITHVVE